MSPCLEALGGTAIFTETEKMNSLNVVAKHIDGRIPIMIGIGAMTTDESVRLAKYSSENGADAVLVVPLNYWPLTEAELVAHFEAVAFASDVPVWLYNNPGLAGIDLTPGIISKLAKTPNVVGMKDSSGDLTRTLTVPKITGGKIAVGLGQDTLILEPLLGDTPAWFTGLANVCPALCVELWTAAKVGNVKKAREVAGELFELSEIGSRYGIIRVAHTALGLLGLSVGEPRRPIRNLDGVSAIELREALVRLGLS